MTPIVFRCLLVSSLALAPPAGNWQSVVTDCFEIYFHPDKRPAVEELLDEADGICADISADLGKPFPAPTYVWIAADRREFRSIQPEGSRISEWVAGVAYPQHRLIILKIEGGGADPEETLKSIFAHETSHIALYHALGGRRPPRWFSEGFAMYQAREWSLERASALAYAAVSNSLIPLSRLEDCFPTDLARARLAYDQSKEFIAFIISEYGRQALHRIVSELMAGRDIKAAVKLATGKPFSVVEDEWLAAIRLHYNWIPLLTASSTLWLLITLLAVMAYIRYRRRKRARIAAMEESELLYKLRLLDAHRKDEAKKSDWIH